MMLKSTLWGRWIENIRQSSWLWAVNFFIFVLYKLCKSVLFMAEEEYYNITYYDLKIGESILSDSMMLLISVLAIAAGIQGFSYLHSKAKVDMYHSQPISERNRFFWIYANGILCFGFPCMIGWLMEVFTIFVCSGRGGQQIDFLHHMMKISCFQIILELILYFSIYQIAVWMAILTNNVVFSVVCTVTVMVYEMLTRKIVCNFAENFFHTYYVKSEEQMRSCKVSVLYLFEQMKENICYGMSGTEMLKQLACQGLWIVLLSVITAVLAYIAYKKRPLENINMPFVFPILRSVFKVVFMVPGILITIYVTEFEMNGGRMTGIFSISLAVICGFLVVAFIGHCVLEMIFEKDIKGILKHKVSAIVSVGIAAVVLMIFQFDVLGYNRYVPKEKDIESIALVIYEEDENTDVLEDAKLYETSGSIWDGQREEYILEHMQLSSIKEVCQLARDNCRYTWKQAKEDKSVTMQQVIVAFHMKNGKTIYRNYYIVSQEGEDLLRKIQQGKEYIQGIGIWMYHEQDGNGT